jgi:hypothetical protein
VLGQVILTILTIISLYGTAVKAAQFATAGTRVVLGLVTAEAAEVEAAAARTALTLAKEAEAAAQERLKLANIQKTVATLREKVPNLFKQAEKLERAPKTSGAGSVPRGAPVEGASKALPPSGEHMARTPLHGIATRKEELSELKRR